MHSVRDTNVSPDRQSDAIDDLDDDDVEDVEDIDEETIVMSDDDFEDDADISMEVNVEKLVAEFEKADSDDVHRRAEIRRRLEELTDAGELEDTYAIEFDD